LVHLVSDTRALWSCDALYAEGNLPLFRTDRQSNSATTFLVRPRSFSRWVSRGAGVCM